MRPADSTPTLGPCLNEGQIAELVAGALDAEALQQAEAHLDACDACRALVGSVAVHEREAKTPPAPARGTEVGRYIVVGEIGRGGAGQVFSAYDATLDRRVAIKLLRVSSEAKQRKLEDEARALARLTHPNVITLYEAGRWNGRAFLCMEFVSGGTVRDWVNARPRQWRDVVQLFLGAGAGVAAAHGVGLVHRDIKPENILVRPDGRAVVTDFGLATEAPLEFELDARLSTLPRHTLDAGFVGTPAYMAADQLRGHRADVRSDQFSFCVTLYEMLFGVRPFEATTVGGLLQSIDSQRIAFPPGQASRRLRRVLERGLQADPSRRFPSMNALLDALERATKGFTPVALVAGGVVVAAAVLALQGRATVVGPCAESDERLAAVWSDARASEVRSALLATRSPVAERAASRLSSVVRERLSVLRSTRIEACRLVESARDSKGYWSRRVSCLDERAAELQMVVDVLSRPDAVLASMAPELVERLPGVRACRTDSSSVESSPEARERRERLLAAATTASTLLATGRPNEAKARLDAEHVETSDVPAFSLQRALCLQALEGPAAAESRLVETALEASRRGEPFVSATSYLELSAQALRRLQLGTASAWLEHARAQAALVNDSVLDVRIEAAKAEVLVRTTEPVAAVTALTQAVAQLDRSAEVRDDVVRLRIALALALKESGQLERSLASIDETVRAATTALGERHPSTLDAIGTRALVLEQQGHADEAIASLRAVVESLGTPTTANAAQVLRWSNNLAFVLNAKERFAESEVVTDAASPALADTFGPESMGSAVVLETLGTAKLGVGKRDAALAAADRGVTLCTRGVCLPHHEGALHFLRAKALLAAGNRAEALVEAHQAELLFGLAKENGRARLERLAQWLAAIER